MAPTQIQQRPVSGPPATQQQAQNLPAIAPPRIPYHPAVEKEFGITKVQWRVLVESIFPSARTIEGVILALSYCKARRLDVFKHPIHIVPIWNKALGREVESVWPGIGELRTTAFRTGVFAGMDETEFGPLISEQFGETMVEAPEWARVTVYRLVNGVPCKFVGPKVYWRETYSRRGKNPDPNDMWLKRPNGQLEKCATAAALRNAFPEEIGEYIPEEIERTDARPATVEIPAESFRELAEAQLVERRLEQQEVENVLQTATAVTEPEPELVPRQNATQEPPQQMQQAGLQGVPSDLGQLEVWLVDNYRTVGALKEAADQIMETFDSSQWQAVMQVVKKRIAAMTKAASQQQPPAE